MKNEDVASLTEETATKMVASDYGMFDDKQVTYLACKFKAVGEYVVKNHLQDLSAAGAQMIAKRGDASLAVEILNNKGFLESLSLMQKLSFFPSVAASNAELGKIILEQYGELLDAHSLRFIALKNLELRGVILAKYPEVKGELEQQLEFNAALEQSGQKLQEADIDLSGIDGFSAHYDFVAS